MDFSARISKRTEVEVKPSDELARSLVSKSENIKSRLLESMNNEYQEFDEGNTQANWGSSYTYVVRTDQFSQYNVIKVKTTGVSMTSNSIVTISSNYFLREILVSNQVLIVIGYTGGYTLVYKFPLLANGDIDWSNYSYFFKRGYPAGSREKNNRAIIVT